MADDRSPSWPSPFTDVTPIVASDVDFQASDLEAGSKLKRSYRGVDHWVYVTEVPAAAPATWTARRWGRYFYAGRYHKSLTAVARAIAGGTDPRINGGRFFGLRRRRR